MIVWFTKSNIPLQIFLCKQYFDIYDNVHVTKIFVKLWRDPDNKTYSIPQQHKRKTNFKTKNRKMHVQQKTAHYHFWGY
jgi:hypothetical protein